MDVVLPISIKRRGGAKSDLLRLKILCTSMRKFWAGDGVFRVITPDVAEVTVELDRLGVSASVVHDDDLFSAIPAKLHPWWRQQLLKLAAHRIVTSDFYLIFDADCFFVKPTSDADLLIDGRGRVTYGVGDAYSHNCWYRGCEKLGLPKPAESEHVNVTPFVMHRELAKRAFDFIKDRPESIGKLGWSEYTLYQCLAQHEELWDRHHISSNPFLGNAVWRIEDLPAWDPAPAFNGSFNFSLVQSNTGVTAEDVWLKVRPWLT